MRCSLKQKIWRPLVGKRSVRLWCCGGGVLTLSVRTPQTIFKLPPELQTPRRPTSTFTRPLLINLPSGLATDEQASVSKRKLARCLSMSLFYFVERLFQAETKYTSDAVQDACVLWRRNTRFIGHRTLAWFAIVLVASF